MIIDFSKYKLEILLFILFFYSLIFCNLSKSRVLFIESNDEASWYFWRKPWENTLFYMPLNWDLLEKSWNQNNWTRVWTWEFRTLPWSDKKYAFIKPSSAISILQYPIWTWNPNDFTFVCWWLPNTSSWYLCWFYMWTDTTWKRNCLILNYHGWISYYQHMNDLYSYNAILSSNLATPQSAWQRCLIIYTYEKSSQRQTLYINNVQTWTTTSYSLNTWNTFKYIWRSLSDTSSSNYWLSEVIFESWIWTQQQREDYFNKTKSKYWIS